MSTRAVFHLGAIAFLAYSWFRLRGVLFDIQKDHTDSRWIDRLIFHEAGAFSDLHQQASAQVAEAAAVAALRHRVAADVDQAVDALALAPAADDSAARGGRATTAGAAAGTASVQHPRVARLPPHHGAAAGLVAAAGAAAAELEGFEQLWADDIAATIAAAHAQRGARHQAAVQAAGGAGACIDAGAAEEQVVAHALLSAAGGSTDWAARGSGGAVAFENKLTSPSYNDQDSGHVLSATVRHVLRLKTAFPPPQHVIGGHDGGLPPPPPPPAGSSTEAAAAAANQQPQQQPLKKQQGVEQLRCWAMAGTEGTFTVRLAKPRVVTHVSVGHLPWARASQAERSAAPRAFQVLSRSSRRHVAGMGRPLPSTFSSHSLTFLPCCPFGCSRHGKAQSWHPLLPTPPPHFTVRATPLFYLAIYNRATHDRATHDRATHDRATTHEVWGLASPSDPSPVRLGAFEYTHGQGQGRLDDRQPQDDGRPLALQTFAINHTAAVGAKQRPVSALVTLHALSNHGHPDFTCLSKFKVHSVDF